MDDPIKKVSVHFNLKNIHCGLIFNEHTSDVLCLLRPGNSTPFLENVLNV